MGKTRYAVKDEKCSKANFYKTTKSNEDILVNNGALHVHKDDAHLWDCIPHDKIDKQIRSYIEIDSLAMVSSNVTKDVAAMLLADPTLQVDLEKYRNKNAMLLNCSNGVLDISTNEVHEYSRDYYFDYCLDFNYIPHCTIDQAPVFKQYCITSLEVEKNPKKLRLLLQLIGYLISSVSGADIMAIFCGKSNSGKSVLLTVIEKVVGERFTTNIPMNRFSSPYILGQLENSRLNVSREIPSSKIGGTDVLKSIVSGDRIFGELKFTNGHSFYPHCKLLFAGNNLPMLSETDGNNEAVINRFKILNFNVSIDREDFDLQLESKLMMERDVIFSMAVDTLPELIKNNFQFEEPEDSVQLIQEYRTTQQVLPEFVAEQCIYGKEYREHTKNIVDAFVSYCKANCYDSGITAQMVSSYIANLPDVKRAKFRIKGSNSLWGFEGIRLKNDEEKCNILLQD